MEGCNLIRKTFAICGFELLVVRWRKHNHSYIYVILHWWQHGYENYIAFLPVDHPECDTMVLEQSLPKTDKKNITRQFMTICKCPRLHKIYTQKKVEMQTSVLVKNKLLGIKPEWIRAGTVVQMHWRCCWLMAWKSRTETLTVFLSFLFKSYSLQRMIYLKNSTVGITNRKMMHWGSLEQSLKKMLTSKTSRWLAFRKYRSRLWWRDRVGPAFSLGFMPKTIEKDIA